MEPTKNVAPVEPFAKSLTPERLATILGFVGWVEEKESYFAGFGDVPYEVGKTCVSIIRELLADRTKAETKAAGLLQEMGDQEREKLELIQANAGLGDLLGDVLHDLKEAWGEGEWLNIHNLIQDLEAKAGIPAPPASAPVAPVAGVAAGEGDTPAEPHEARTANAS